MLSPRVRQWLRAWGATWLTRTLAPVREKLGVLQFLQWVILLWLLLRAHEWASLGTEIATAWTTGQVLLYALPFFAVANLITAAIAAKGEIAKRGAWHGSRFVYHSPLHVFTTELGPQDHEKFTPFVVKDAEPESFVHFRIDYHGGLGVAEIGRKRGLPSWPTNHLWDQARHPPRDWPDVPLPESGIGPDDC